MPPERRPESFQHPLPPLDAERDEELTLLSSQEVSRVNQGLNEGEPPLEQLAEEGCTEKAVNPTGLVPDCRVNSEPDPPPYRERGCLPTLNGQTDTFWQIVNDHPNALPAQIANKLHAATNRNLTGAQVKALIDAGSPEPVHIPNDQCPF